MSPHLEHVKINYDNHFYISHDVNDYWLILKQKQERNPLIVTIKNTSTDSL